MATNDPSNTTPADCQSQVFDKWLSSHEALFYKVIRSYAFSPHDQEDLLQEILLRVWNSIPQFREQSSATTWLYRIALCTAMDWSKSTRRQRGREQQLENQLFQIDGGYCNPQLDWIYEQIAQLDEIDRSLILLWLDRFSYQEIANLLGISESNVGVKLSRIKIHLKHRSNQHEL